MEHPISMSSSFHNKTPAIIARDSLPAADMKQHGSRGFTLVELLVALVITMVGLMGLLASINLSISTNLSNELRLQAIGIAEDVLNDAKKQPFANMTANWSVSTMTSGLPISSPPQHYFIRGSERDYTVAKSVADFTDTKQISAGVSWVYRNQRFEHTASTIVGKPYGSQ